MPILYTKKDKGKNSLLSNNWKSSNNSTTLNKNLGRELQPYGRYVSGIDIVKEFPWTLTPTTSRARQTAPYIILKEFFQLENRLNQVFLPYNRTDFSTTINTVGDVLTGDFSNITAGSVADSIWTLLTVADIQKNTNALYRGLFDHNNETGFKYVLPYFNKEYFKIDNQWQGVNILDKIIDLQVKTSSFALKKLGLFGIGSTGLLQKVAQTPRILKDIEIFNLQNQNPTVGLMDPPKVWKSSTPRSYSFQFPLYNIELMNNTDSKQLIAKNWEFCYLLTYQNLVNKRNFFTGIPPVFYEVEIPGVHYCKASYINNLSIQNLGNIRKLSLPLNGNIIDVNVPDAYFISITLTDLLTPSKNLLASTVNSSARKIAQRD